MYCRVVGNAAEVRKVLRNCRKYGGGVRSVVDGTTKVRGGSAKVFGIGGCLKGVWEMLQRWEGMVEV